MHILHTNIPVPVFGGEVRLRPEVRAVEMRT